MAEEERLGEAEIIDAIRRSKPYMQQEARAMADTILRNLLAAGLEIRRKGEDELRIIVVYRADLLEMTRGKGEVQFGHAVEGLLASADFHDLERYRESSRLKVAMEVDDLPALDAIRKKAEARGVRHHVVTDAGRTCFDGPTVTCIAFGPMSKTDGNAITRGARMRP